jgi:GTP cyclohydrolase I
MPDSPDLPDHVRKLVAEIEREIGEDDEILNGKERDGDAAEAELTRPIVGSSDLSTPPGPVEEAVREILLEIGEDPDRQGLRNTPERVHRMYAELTAGYHVDPARLVNGAIFDVDYSEMVVVRDIPFYSLCEHHLLPFFGTAAVAYIPRGKVIEANHLCAVMRGIRKPGTVMTTSAVLGLFRTRDRTRAEFFSHLERRRPGD